MRGAVDRPRARKVLLIAVAVVREDALDAPVEVLVVIPVALEPGLPGVPLAPGFLRGCVSQSTWAVRERKWQEGQGKQGKGREGPVRPWYGARKCFRKMFTVRGLCSVARAPLSLLNKVLFVSREYIV